MKTYDVHFNDDEHSNSEGFKTTFEYCYNYIKSNLNSTGSFFEDYKNGTVSIYCNEEGEHVYYETIGDTDDLKNFYFTFPKDSINSKKYVLIYAEDWDSARKKMNLWFKDQWAFQYEIEDWILPEEEMTIADKYNLEFLDINLVITKIITNNVQ